MHQKQEEIIPTRESLLGRLKNWKDDKSWREFFGIYRKLIFSMAVKSGLSGQEAEEVVQETLISVAKTIPDFEYNPGRCSFKSWLRHLAQRRIADYFRKRARERTVGFPQVDETAQTPAAERVPDANAADLDAVWEEEWHTELLNAAIVQVKNQVSAEQYQMFDFYVLKKMPVAKVAKALSVSATQIYLAKHRITRLLKKEIARLEKKMGD
ncbi:MAG TPA: sigma-70 family RNA polymerase sigma factor [Verrucomicrobiae bacterium]|jgi:RNA polymerase sigma-70 factor (ECF subfamily)|nr:sigma-70 family RNA polymerase sigma factor [Verrucomicrobiae bacterium]